MCVHRHHPSSPSLSAREHTCASRTDMKRIQRVVSAAVVIGGRRGGQDERGRSDYRARASGCPRRVRPDPTRSSPSFSRTIHPISPFLEHGPRGIPLDFSAPVYTYTPGSRNVKAKPSRRHAESRMLGFSASAASDGFKDLCNFHATDSYDYFDQCETFVECSIEIIFFLSEM